MNYKLFLDDKRSIQDTYKYTKNPVYLEGNWITVRNYEDFVKTINENGLPSFVSFDHDLADPHYASILDKEIDYSKFKEKTGYECAKWLVNYCIDSELDFPKYFVHSFNTVGRQNIVSYIENFKRTR